MEHQKILNLLNKASDSIFLIKKLSMISQMYIMMFYTEVLKSNFSVYNDD